MTLIVTTAAITLPELNDDVQSVDVFFGADRVWSIDLNDSRSRHRRKFVWPHPLRPFLVGSTTVSIRRSGSEHEIASVDTRFTEDEVLTRVLDEAGVPLAINKWGRLGKTLEVGNPGVQERILDRTTEVIAHLKDMGLRPFVVGGTLLGGVRDQALLPHDDDADVAYLSSFTAPVDVATEGFAVGRKLQKLGYELVRHSATHMQLYFRDDHGRLDHYVDVFAAFFTEDGCINQPFHVRGEFREDQMLPFSEVTIQGRLFPAPADSEAWLVINYDENWRTPIPGYRLATPPATIRRFQNWFGSFHQTRDFWNDHYAKLGAAGDDPWRTGREWIISRESELSEDWLVDLGAGTGELGMELLKRSPHRRVIAADFSPESAKLTDERVSDRLLVHHTNLYRLNSLAMPEDAGVDGPFDFVANHVFDHLGRRALPQAFRLARMALRSGGRVFVTLYGRELMDAPRQDPTSWGLSARKFVQIAAQYGLDADITQLRPVRHERRRAPYGARLMLGLTREKESL